MLLVNDTGVDIRDLGIEAAIRESIATGDGLPEEIADLFSVNVIEVDGEKRAIVDWL
jgi:hypothetical protein